MHAQKHQKKAFYEQKYSQIMNKILSKVGKKKNCWKEKQVEKKQAKQAQPYQLLENYRFSCSYPKLQKTQYWFRKQEFFLKIHVSLGFLNDLAVSVSCSTWSQLICISLAIPEVIVLRSRSHRSHRVSKQTLTLLLILFLYNIIIMALLANYQLCILSKLDCQQLSICVARQVLQIGKEN